MIDLRVGMTKCWAGIYAGNVFGGFRFRWLHARRYQHSFEIPNLMIRAFRGFKCLGDLDSDNGDVHYCAMRQSAFLAELTTYRAAGFAASTSLHSKQNYDRPTTSPIPTPHEQPTGIHKHLLTVFFDTEIPASHDG